MLISKDVIKMYQKKITHMPNETYRHLAFQIDMFYKEHGFINSADLISYLNDEKNIYFRFEINKNSIKMANDNIENQLQNQQLTNITSELKSDSVIFQGITTLSNLENALPLVSSTDKYCAALKGDIRKHGK